MSSTLGLDRYAWVLRGYLIEEPTEVGLLQAYELGRFLMEEGVGLLEVLRLHSQAIERLEAEDGIGVVRSRAESFLTEVVGPFEMAYLGFQEANSALRTLTASLERQVDERTQQVQESLSELRSIDADRRRLLARLVAAQEDERHRLADDLHDDTIQVMAAASLRLATLRRWVSPEGRPALDRLEATVTAAIDRLRRLVFELRPPALDHEGLGAAVEAYAREAFAEEEGPVVVVDERIEEQPPVEVREILYRIVQEALANARKHAAARRVEVAIQEEVRGVRAVVTDDGRGCDPRLLEVGRPGHLGVSAMRERAEMVGGWCTIDSAPDRGTTVSCWLPMDGGTESPAVR